MRHASYLVMRMGKWFVRLEMISIFYKILGNEFYGFIALFASSKDALSWLVIFGKLIENLIDKKWFWKIWEPCEYIGYFKGFVETTWKWTVFWILVNFELFMFLPLGYDMWLPGEYLVRYYSLCGIGILAPVFVVVMSFGFVSVDEFRLCVGDEFRLCVSRFFGFVLAMSFDFVLVD